MTWLPLVVALVALLGVIITNIVTAVNNRALVTKWQTELTALENRTTTALDNAERQDKRAKAIDIYKWASDRALSSDDRIAQSGVDALAALLDGELLDDDMKQLVAVALSGAYAQIARQIEAAGDDVEVVQLALEAEGTLDVPLTVDESDEPTGGAGD